MSTNDEQVILATAHKTITNILAVLSQQDARIKQLEIQLNIASKTNSNKDHLIKKLEKALDTFDSDISISGLKQMLEDVSGFIAWNSNRLFRLEKQLKEAKC